MIKAKFLRKMRERHVLFSMFLLGSDSYYTAKNIIIGVFTVTNENLLLKYYFSTGIASLPMITQFLRMQGEK